MGTYEQDVAVALRERRASTCTCGASNPPHYDACHDCGQPLVTCATCGTVSPQRFGGCTECGCETYAESLGAHEEGYELTHAEFVNLQVGPRRVGGCYRVGANGEAYEVLDIERERPLGTWPSWQITVRWLSDGRTTSHCTRWDDRRDTVVEQPPADDGKDAWRYTADVVAVDPDGRVLLIERRWEPFGWALPGGHLDEGEDSRPAAARELAEETGVRVDAADLTLIGTYNAPGRDPRGRYSTDAYLARVPADTVAVADDDAKNVRWVELSAVLEEGALAFDHADILRAAGRMLSGGEVT